MERKRFKKNLMMVIMAVAMMIGGVMVVPRTASAAVTDTVLRWPTNNTKLSQNFSATSKSVHQGVDIPGTLNDSIYAAEAGTIVSRGCIKGGYGNYIVIQHQSGLFTLYGHLNKYAANTEVNKKVTKGQVIAYMGNTGYSTGVHLHFEVRKVKTLYYDSQLSEIQKNLYNPMSFKYVYTNSASQPTPTNNKPIGNIDGVVCDIPGYIHIGGWAFDKDNPGSAVDIHVYVGGAASPNVPCAPIKANLLREDVDNVHKCGKYHGFGAQISTNKTGNIAVYIYAIDTAGGENTFLGSRTVYVTAHSHNYNIAGTITKAATCTENGTQVFKCSCGATTTKTITCLGHDWEQIPEQQPTCTKYGVYAYKKCKRCGTSRFSNMALIIDPTGHNWNDGEITTAPTCTEDGVITYTCTKCGETETETIEKTGHEIVTDAAVEATYTTIGLTEGSHCAKCNVVLKAQETIPMLKQETQISQSTIDGQVPQPIQSATPSIDNKSLQINKTDTQKDANTTNEYNDGSDDTYTNADFEYQIDEDDEVMYCRPDNLNVKAVIIPDIVIIDGETYEVTSIDDDAFKNCKNLTKVVIGRNITEIGDRAFKGCSKLKNIEIKTIELTKKSIGKNAFKGIGKKATFKFPKKVYKKYKKWIKRAGAPVNARYKKFG